MSGRDKLKIDLQLFNVQSCMGFESDFVTLRDINDIAVDEVRKGGQRVNPLGGRKVPGVEVMGDSLFLYGTSMQDTSRDIGKLFIKRTFGDETEDVGDLEAEILDVGQRLLAMADLVRAGDMSPADAQPRTEDLTVTMRKLLSEMRSFEPDAIFNCLLKDSKKVR